MKNIKVLDCTLRDGGRIINCEFRDSDIVNMTEELTEANIDIIEMGFLRSHDLVNYRANSTFFTEAAQITPFIPKNRKNSMYVAFIDFDMYDFSVLEKCDGNSVTGIRVGFTKKQFDNKLNEIKKALLRVKAQGYKLFIQAVNALAYSDREMLDLLDLVNEIQPYSYGIVDTYGAMYLEDIVRFYNLVDHNLNKEICIDIHSHNNFQLSFAFAQEIIRLSGDTRNIILDATLDGMGKCAGNLNTELIVDYLNRKKQYDYDFNKILDIIDEYIYLIKKDNQWGYSIPAFMAGIYKSHPNNVIYLTEKFRLNTKDIKNMISMIDEDVRQRYDYDNIERIYIDYNQGNSENVKNMEHLKEKFKGKKVLLLVPGNSLVEEKEKIDAFVKSEKPIIISVNFETTYRDAYVFWGNSRRYHSSERTGMCSNEIICTNVVKDDSELCLVDYNLLINRGYKFFDNSTMMVLNLLKKLNPREIYIAGFDGFSKDKANNFVDESFADRRYVEEFDLINQELEKMTKEYYLSVKDSIKISFLTSSRFEKAIIDGI